LEIFPVIKGNTKIYLTTFDSSVSSFSHKRKMSLEYSLAKLAAGIWTACINASLRLREEVFGSGLLAEFARFKNNL